MSRDIYISGQNKEKVVRLPDEYIGEQSIRDAVAESVSMLPTRLREATILYYYDELSVGEIASAMGVAHNSVLKYLAQAKKRLAAELEDAYHSRKISAMALHSIGNILSESLQAGTEELYPSNVISFKRMMSQCQRQIMGDPDASRVPEVTKKKSKASRRMIPFGLAVSACSAVIIAGALTLGILFGGISRQAAVDSMAAHQAAGEARIVYTKGEDDRSSERVNPVQADLLAGNPESPLNVIHWWITLPDGDSDVILYEDSDGNLNIGEALIMLKENGHYGEYNLNLRFSDDHGDIYRMSSNFFISDELVPLAANP